MHLRAVTVVVIGAAFCGGGCDRRAAEAEREAARTKSQAESQAADDARHTRRRLDDRDAGVLTTAPAWAPSPTPPANADELKADFDPLEVLVRYRRPPGDTQECLEYYVDGVVKRRMSFTRPGDGGTQWYPAGTRDSLHGGFVIHFLGADGLDVLPEKVIRFDGHVLEQGSRVGFHARLTPAEVRGVRVVRFTNLGFSAGGVPAPAPGR